MKLAGCALALTLLAFPASAATILDTGEPTQRDGGLIFDDQQSLAAPFTLSSSATISSVSIFLETSLSYVPLSGGTFEVEIRDGKDAPGTILFEESTSFSGEDDWAGLSGLSWDLTAGSYWATFEVLDGQTIFAAAPVGAPNPTPVVASDPKDGSGFQVYQTDDTNNFGVRVLGVSAAPEPALWVMMLAGIGLLGGVARAGQLGCRGTSYRAISD